MPKEEREIMMRVSKTEMNFIKFCREIGFAAGQLYIMDGVPKKLENPVKSVRFDLSRSVDNQPLTDNNETK